MPHRPCLALKSSKGTPAKVCGAFESACAHCSNLGADAPREVPGAPNKCTTACKAPPAAYAQAEDQGDTITFMFESENQERISDFELKLMDIDSEQLGIPDTEYTATVRMPSSEFQRICKCASASVYLWLLGRLVNSRQA